MGKIVEIEITRLPAGKSLNSIESREALIGMTFTAEESSIPGGRYEVELLKVISALKVRGVEIVTDWPIQNEKVAAELVYVFLKETCQEISPTT